MCPLKTVIPAALLSRDPFSVEVGGLRSNGSRLKNAAGMTNMGVLGSLKKCRVGTALSCPLFFGLLTSTYKRYILIHPYHNTKETSVKTTLNIDDELLRKAAKLTGIEEKTSLVRLGLEALIARESSRRLAKLGGTEKQLEVIPRRKWGDA
jgi:hypothetical protein